MNIIDKNFNNLINELNNSSYDEILEKVKTSFSNINENTKKSIIDFFNKFPYWGNNIEEHFKLITDSLYYHLEDYKWLYKNLNDYKSKQALFAILNNWYICDFTNLSKIRETNFKHYFDLDLITTNEEVFVDIGAYTGDTILDFVNSFTTNSYKKIYAYEITEDTINKLKENTKHLDNIIINKKAIMDKEELFYITESKVDASANTISNNGNIEIESTTLDKDIKEKITMIKMDIEGSEEKALIGAKKHIINDQPKLLISIYHNHEDLYKIPKMIEKFTPDTYNYYIRYYGGNIFPTEIVLIAIPKNK